jgi:catechol 2,3-dioxygenase
VTAPEPKLPGATTVGPVSLTVADLDGVAAFYQKAIGLEPRDGAPGTARLGAGDRTLVELVGDREAPPRPPGTTGLFHLAILVPDRPALATAMRRVAAAGGRFTGASDHLVSEALYLNDPEGNGIEIYRDRSRDEWTYRDGQLEMDTLPLDLRNLLAEEDGDAPGMPAGTIIGHVHLNVADIPASEGFYADALGFDVTVRGYPGALFVSAGGYHHHLGLNVWNGEGAPPPPAGSRGLRHFEVVLPSEGDAERAAARLRDAGFEHEDGDEGIRVRDPTGNGVLLRG